MLVKIHPDTANRIGQLIILIILTEVTAMVFQYLREMVLTKLIQWPRISCIQHPQDQHYQRDENGPEETVQRGRSYEKRNY